MSTKRSATQRSATKGSGTVDLEIRFIYFQFLKQEVKVLTVRSESIVSFCPPKLKSGSIPRKNCTEFFIVLEESNLNLRIP